MGEALSITDHSGLSLASHHLKLDQYSGLLTERILTLAIGMNCQNEIDDANSELGT